METLLLVQIKEKKLQVIVSVRQLFVKRPNNCLRNLVLRFLVQLVVLWRSFLAPSGGLSGLEKGLDYTAMWGMVMMLMEIGMLLSNIMRKWLRREALFCSRCLIVTKQTSSGRECHAEHISQRGRLPCLAISQRGLAYIALLCQCFGGLQGQTTARVQFGEAQSFQNIRKNRLGILWRSNHKAWVTRSTFSDWVIEVFEPTVRDYLREKDLPLKVLLVMDNAPAHPPNLMEELPDEFSFIKVHFLPPNMTPLLQPTDQQAITNFKKTLH